MSDEERRELQHVVIDYHYDVGGYNFVYASFYITDCDRNFRSACHDEALITVATTNAVEIRKRERRRVRKLNGIENEITIEGPAGTGFVQDTSCYHRASPPTRGDRLMLAVRFIQLSISRRSPLEDAPHKLTEKWNLGI